ncbi:MAG: hypothetical protein WBD40_07250 [Tepidisphaeraceae bacterium]
MRPISGRAGTAPAPDHKKLTRRLGPLQRTHAIAQLAAEGKPLGECAIDERDLE